MSLYRVGDTAGMRQYRRGAWGRGKRRRVSLNRWLHVWEVSKTGLHLCRFCLLWCSIRSFLCTRMLPSPSPPPPSPASSDSDSIQSLLHPATHPLTHTHPLSLHRPPLSLFQPPPTPTPSSPCCSSPPSTPTPVKPPPPPTPSPSSWPTATTSCTPSAPAWFPHRTSWSPASAGPRRWRRRPRAHRRWRRSLRCSSPRRRRDGETRK